MKLHVLQIAPCFVDLDHETGGVSNIVRQIALNLTRNNHRVTVFCGNTELGKVKAIPGVHRISDHLIQHIQCQRLNPLLGPGIDLSQLSIVPGEGVVAHIHTCLSAFTESAMAKCLRLGIPFVFTPHGKLASITSARHRVIKNLYWRYRASHLVSQASSIVLSGSTEAVWFDHLGIRNEYNVIPNGYVEPASGRLSTLKPIIDLPYVLFLGYLEERKQPGFLIEVFAQSRLRFTHKLVLAGPDAYGHKAQLEEIAKRCLVADRVVFFGAAYGEEKASLFQHAACLCLPSKAEGLPVVLCEAIGSGIPVLYSTGCNFPELVQHGCGLEISGFDLPEWKEALERICLDEYLNQKMRAAATRIRIKYAWDSICQEWLQLYRTCISKDKAG